jgi:hypothetical protein
MFSADDFWHSGQFSNILGEVDFDRFSLTFEVVEFDSANPSLIDIATFCKEN